MSLVDAKLTEDMFTPVNTTTPSCSTATVCWAPQRRPSTSGSTTPGALRLGNDLVRASTATRRVARAIQLATIRSSTCQSTASSCEISRARSTSAAGTSYRLCKEHRERGRDDRPVYGGVQWERPRPWATMATARRTSLRCREPSECHLWIGFEERRLEVETLLARGEGAPRASICSGSNSEEMFYETSRVAESTPCRQACGCAALRSVAPRRLRQSGSVCFL